jgi:hypothetical protein
MDHVMEPTPASAIHMFNDCLMIKQVWAEADQLGRSFWPSYTAFDYHKDITLLVHEYRPVTLFKMAVLWSLWRYWCELFYQPQNFGPERFALIVPEVMLMVRDQLLQRLSESRAVIQWLGVIKDRRTSPDPGSRTPEKEFLLVDCQSISWNPLVFDLPDDNPLVADWLGNNVLCYRRGSKLAFNHAVWYVYKNQAENLLPDSLPEDPDYDDEHEEDVAARRAGAFMEMDY